MGLRYRRFEYNKAYDIEALNCDLCIDYLHFERKCITYLRAYDICRGSPKVFLKWFQILPQPCSLHSRFSRYMTRDENHEEFVIESFDEMKRDFQQVRTFMDIITVVARNLYVPCHWGKGGWWSTMILTAYQVRVEGDPDSRNMDKLSIIMKFGTAYVIVTISDG